MGIRLLFCAILSVIAASAVSFADKTDAPEKDTAANSKSDDGGKKYALQYKFSPNQFVHTKVRFKTSMTTQHRDFIQKTSDDTATRRHFRVVSVNSKGIATLETTLDHVRMQVQFGDSEPTIFDSSEDISKAGPFRNVWKSIGKPRARFQFTRRGELLSVALLRGAATQRRSREQVEADAKQNFLIVLPEDPVAVGDWWHDDIKIRVFLPDNKKLQKTISLRRKYSLEKVEDSIATISLKTITLTRIGAAQIEAQLIQRTPSGTILFDIEQGQIISRESRVDKVVIGALGTPQSSMRATSFRREKLVEPGKVAQNR